MGEFGNLLIQLRGKMSLHEISKIIGVSHTYIRDLELGKKTNPSDETLLKISKVYNISPYELAKLLLKEKWKA